MKKERTFNEKIIFTSRVGNFILTQLSLQTEKSSYKRLKKTALTVFSQLNQLGDSWERQNAITEQLFLF